MKEKFLSFIIQGIMHIKLNKKRNRTNTGVDTEVPSSLANAFMHAIDIDAKAARVMPSFKLFLFLF